MTKIVTIKTGPHSYAQGELITDEAFAMTQVGGKTFKELGFKAGDKVRCVAVRSRNWMCSYKVGDVFTIGGNNMIVIERGLDGSAADWEHVDWIEQTTEKKSD